MLVQYWQSHSVSLSAFTFELLKNNALEKLQCVYYIADPIALCTPAGNVVNSRFHQIEVCSRAHCLLHLLHGTTIVP